MDLIPKVVKNVLLKLEENGFEAYLVGGAVRDFLLVRETNDYDIATNALPKDILAIFGPSRKDIEYGSFHITIEEFHIDITTYRKEILYKDCKLIDMEYTNNLIFDAERRDFTINALYQNKNGDILDPLGVVGDVKKRILKMIGNPSVRFLEDPLRILRAVRFSLVYHLKMDKTLVKAIKKEKKNLKKVSKQRIKKELDFILLADGFSLLKKLDLLEVLGIHSKKVVYVEDLAGLWVQLNCSVDYPKEKNLKNREKTIEYLIKCGTMNMLLFYQYGYYDCSIACKILHFPLKKLEKMQKMIPIRSRNDIVFSSIELQKLSDLKGKEFGLFLEELETKIILKEIKNTKEDILKYIKER